MIRQGAPNQYSVDDQALDAHRDNQHQAPGFIALEGPNAYELNGASICRDSGTIDTAIAPQWLLPPWDLIGNARVWGCQVDMGAKEYGSSFSCMGDLDHDGDVDGIDVHKFIASGLWVPYTKNVFHDLGTDLCPGCI